MALPAGVSKASGLESALALVELSPHNAVGIGDAENDHAFLRLCGYAVVVANFLPMLKESADFVTEEPRRAGVASLVRQMIADDLAQLTQELPDSQLNSRWMKPARQSGFHRAVAKIKKLRRKGRTKKGSKLQLQLFPSQ